MEPSSGKGRTAHSEYYKLQRKLRELDKQESYQEASQVAERMIALLNANRTLFDELEDRIRILQARRLSMVIKDRRFVAGESIVDLYRQLAEWSRPSACVGQPCPGADAMECVELRPSLSSLQQRMCVERLSALCNALKIEGALAARHFEIDEALGKRRKAVEIHKHIVKFDNAKQRNANQLYLEYWQLVTEHYSSLLQGDFSAAKQWLQKAREVARNLHRCAREG